MKRVLAAFMLVVGMALIVVGVGSATWWKKDSTVQATTAIASESGIVATDPGVLELVDDTVRVSARAPGTTVEMVVASSDIARLWLGDEPHVRVTGLSDWTTLSAEGPAEDFAPEEPLSVQGSDLFHPENFISADDAVELHFVVPEGDWTLIALGQDGTTPQLTITWEREVETPLAIPLIIAGVVLLAAGSALYLFTSQQQHVATRKAESEERSKRRKEADSTDTSVMPAIKVAELTDPVREELREETGGAYGAGILPAAPPPKDDNDSAADDNEGADEVLSGEDDNAAKTDGSEERSVDEGTDNDNLAKIDAESLAGNHGDVSGDTDNVDTSSVPAEELLEESEPECVEDPDHVEESETEISSSSHVDSVDSDRENESDDSNHEEDVDRRATSAEWRSLWGFGPKE